MVNIQPEESKKSLKDAEHQPERIHRFVVIHYSLFREIWDSTIQIATLVGAVSIPLAVAILLSGPKQTVKILEIYNFTFDILFVVNIIINFRTTFINSDGELESDTWKMAKHYITGWFIFDLIVAVPFDLLAANLSAEWNTTTNIGLLKLIHLLRLIKMPLMGSACGYLFRHFAIIALICHWAACIRYALDRNGLLSEKPETMVQINAIDNADADIPSLSQYYDSLRSVLWTSIGCGRENMKAEYEQILTIILMIILCLVYSSLMGCVSAILRHYADGVERYNMARSTLREFIFLHQIPITLEQRLEGYFSNAWSRSNKIDINKMLKELPVGLQSELDLHLNRNPTVLAETSSRDSSIRNRKSGFCGIKNRSNGKPVHYSRNLKRFFRSKVDSNVFGVSEKQGLISEAASPH